MDRVRNNGMTDAELFLMSNFSKVSNRNDSEKQRIHRHLRNTTRRNYLLSIMMNLHKRHYFSMWSVRTKELTRELTLATKNYLTQKSIFFGFRFCNRFKKTWLKRKLKGYFKKWKRETEKFHLKKEEK